MTQMVKYDITYPRDALGFVHINVVEVVQIEPAGPPSSMDGGTWERGTPYMLLDERGLPRSFRTYADALDAATAWKRQRQQH